MCLLEEMEEGAPLSKVRLFHKTHMGKTPKGSEDYIDQCEKTNGSKCSKNLSYILTKKLLVSYDVLFQEKIQKLIAMESQDEYGSQVSLSKEDEDRIFPRVVKVSSHGIYMYGTGQNKSSLAPLDATHQRSRELE